MNDQFRKLIISNIISGKNYEQNIRNLSSEEWIKYCEKENLCDNEDCIDFKEE